jgi:hypothetical protein
MPEPKKYPEKVERTQQVPIKFDASNGEFDRTHDVGSAEFEGAWYEVNNAAVFAASYYTPHHNLATREMLSGVLLAALRRLRTQGYLK